MKYVFSGVIVFIIVGLVILFYIPTQHNIFIHQAKDDFIQFSKLFSVQLNNFFQQEYSKLDMINQSGFFKIALFQYQVSKRKGLLKRHIKKILNQNSTLEGLYLYNIENSHLVSESRREIKFDININTKFKLFQNESDKKYYFYLIRDIQNNFKETIAYLIAVYDYDVITLLGSNFSSDKFGSAFIVDSQGILVYHQVRNEKVNKPWANYNLDHVKNTKFFIRNLEGDTQIYSISKCSSVPFYVGVTQKVSDYLKPFNTILIIITGFAVVLLVIAVLLIFYSPQSKGVRLYDEYLENLTNAITQMAKTSEMASQSTQMAFENTKKEVETIKSILNNFYEFIDKWQKPQTGESNVPKVEIPPIPSLSKEEKIEEPVKQTESDVSMVEEIETETPVIQDEKIEKEPGSSTDDIITFDSKVDTVQITQEEIKIEEKQPEQKEQPVYFTEKTEEVVSIEPDNGKDTEEQEIQEASSLKQQYMGPGVIQVDYDNYPAVGIVDDKGTIKEGEVDKEKLKDIEISNKIVILQESEASEEKGLSEQKGQIVLQG